MRVERYLGILLLFAMIACLLWVADAADAARPAGAEATMNTPAPMAGKAVTDSPAQGADAGRVSIADFDAKAKAGQPLTVVFFGGSLTWGANASDPQKTSYRARMAQWLLDRYPKSQIRFIDAAIGGKGSSLGLFRLERDVMAYKPDLVFLDFTVNDDTASANDHSAACYETILRELIRRGVPVMQAHFTFRGYYEGSHPAYKDQAKHLPRLVQYKAMADAYDCGSADVLSGIGERLDRGEVDLKILWPFDGAHPGDEGYRHFFEIVRDGYLAAVADGRVCRLPAKPVHAVYSSWERAILVDRLPDGWQRERTYPSGLWFDQQASRWMGDVAQTSASKPAPLTWRFRGNSVAVLGEANGTSMSFRVTIDGRPRTPDRSRPDGTWTWNAQRFGGGNLLFFHVLADDLADGEHVLEVTPIAKGADPKAVLRFEAVCSTGKQ